MLLTALFRNSNPNVVWDAVPVHLFVLPAHASIFRKIARGVRGGESVAGTPAASHCLPCILPGIIHGQPKVPGGANGCYINSHICQSGLIKRVVPDADAALVPVR